jgi:hypothetical protein
MDADARPGTPEQLTMSQDVQQAGASPHPIRSWVNAAHLPMVGICRRHFDRLAVLATAPVTGHWRLDDRRWQRNPRRTGLHQRLLRKLARLNQQTLASVSGLMHVGISRLELRL